MSLGKSFNCDFFRRFSLYPLSLDASISIFQFPGCVCSNMADAKDLTYAVTPWRTGLPAFVCEVAT
jgi:hypothetical protein